MGQVLPRDQVTALRAQTRDDGRTVVFTNGCFDVLHRGHIDLLHQARALGDVLVVGVNSDASVRRLKGEGRPVVAEGDRAVVLAALVMVDAVVVFDEDTPLELIQELEPDVLVKGADYRPEDVVGGDAVMSWGGRVELIPLTPGRSTTGLIGRLGMAGTPPKRTR